MTKIISYILAVMVASGIGLFHADRINTKYYSFDSVTESAPPAQYQEPLPERYEQRQDSSNQVIPPQTKSTQPQENQTGDDGVSTFVPSDMALETKFWLDTIGSFLTTIAPFAVPVIIHRTKNNSEQEDK